MSLRDPVPRDRLRRHRRQALQATLLALLPLGAVGGLLAAPDELAAVRLAGVALGWWAAGAAWVVAVLALALRLPPRRPARGG